MRGINRNGINWSKFLAAGILASAAVLMTGCENSFGAHLSGETVTENELVRDIPEEAKPLEEKDPPAPYTEDGIQYYFRAKGKYLSVYNGEEFEDIYIKGVNLGLGKPGYFPGETAVSREEYARWFQQIAEMNANCIRVYTIQPPAFYEAFYRYNRTADKPLYLFQGTWYDETRLIESADAYDEQLQQYLYQDMEQLVDLIHGNCTIEPVPGKASGTYLYDISPYVIGWILGIESDANFVSTTNDEHPDITTYKGNYISTENVEAFEVFWAQTGDYVISYETDKYGMQRPVSYSNWPTADVLEHPSETMDEEYLVDLNMQNLKATDAFPCGLFASYHIYPYYPNFMYTEKAYSDYRDESGEINTYKAYLEDLIRIHDMPVLVAEFGVPASRGVTHANPYTGFDQGNHTDEEQGQMLVSMMQDIYDTGYAGGLVFTWQDEWFKRTWNTESHTNVNRRAYWCDVMTCEQHFGILDFVPGEEQEIVIVDGDAAEWTAQDILLETQDMTLSVKHDCAYLYLMVNKTGADYDTQKLLLPFDVTPKSGSRVYEGSSFGRAADFVLVVDGKENTRLLVQSYYDRYQYEYDKYDKEIQTTAEMREPGNALFHPVFHLLERELVLQDRVEIIPLQKFESGRLVFGISDYDSAQYNSLADYYYKGDILEIRIPWLLLNFRDPSTKEIEDDFWKNKYFSGIKVDGIWVGLSAEEPQEKPLEEDAAIELVRYQWDNWDYYPYFERLRKSYYMLQEQFAGLDI